MCDCTRHKASLASTITPPHSPGQPNAESSAKMESSAHEESKCSNSGSPSQLSNSPPSQLLKSPQAATLNSDKRSVSEQLLAAGLHSNMNTSADSIEFLHDQEVAQEGVRISQHHTVRTSFKQGTKVSLALFNRIAVITSDPLKQMLVKAAQELQYRQDELKSDFSEGIVQLIRSIVYLASDPVASGNATQTEVVYYFEA